MMTVLPRSARSPSRRQAGVLAAVLVGTALSCITAAQQPAPPPRTNPLLKLIEPWPSPKELTKRRLDAEARPLFASAEPLALTLVADVKTVNKDHDPNSQKRYEGELRIPGDGGQVAAVPVQLGARGHVRRMARTCDFVPLRVEFSKPGVAGTVFAHQRALKLVTQCLGGGEYEQYLLREYLAYRMFNLITPRSFRARLARVTYVDRATGREMGTRYGMFLEDEGDVARRMEGRIVKLPRILFNDLDSDSLMSMMVFEYMIGNTDYSIYALHNVRLVQTPDKTLHPVPYDFDMSGLVHPPYATPARGLMITSVLDRVYRGPCRRPEQIDPILANFVAKNGLIRGLADGIVGMQKASRDDARAYLNDFYASIKTTKGVKRLFVDCADKPTM
jgi:hypothetical protein